VEVGVGTTACERDREVGNQDKWGKTGMESGKKRGGGGGGWGGGWRGGAVWGGGGVVVGGGGCSGVG